MLKERGLQLRSMLADDVIVYTDGGGKMRAPIQPAAGLPNVIEPHASLAAIYAESRSKLVRYGLPGFVTIEQGNAIQTTALHIEDGKIVGIYGNPDKLRHLASAVRSSALHQPEIQPRYVRGTERWREETAF
jgi:RNA polymerase sigma-70 factor, ECF subfamily